MTAHRAPTLLRVLDREGYGVRVTPYGSVGAVLDSESTEVVWVAKQDEAIDPDWFCQPDTDVLCVLQGQLRVEFADEAEPDMTLSPGDVLVLPPNTACRAYSWPRGPAQRTMFLAVTAREGTRPPGHGDGAPGPGNGQSDR
jgi:hypothetical protein